jgi:hypothetical protein
MPSFKSVLYLDDIRKPIILGIDVVTNYDEFVAYLKKKDMPDLISFDHDLSTEHYPLGQTDMYAKIKYAAYKEKTGWHCARYIIDNKLPLRNWAVHSANPVGKANIQAELRAYRPRGEQYNLLIPFDVPEEFRDILLPMLGLHRAPLMDTRCCEKDTDGDGNCPDHISPGTYRIPQLARIRREDCANCCGQGLIDGTAGEWDGTPGTPAHECPVCNDRD